MLSIDLSVSDNGRASSKYNLEGDLHGEASLEELLDFVKRNLIAISQYALTEEQAKGFDRKPVIAVDNKIGKPVEQVNPLGKIEYTARVSAPKFLLEIYQAIESRSPNKSGLYKEYNYVFYGDLLIAKNESELQTWIQKAAFLENGKEIRFINVVPYARKLERRGVTSGGTSARARKSRDKKGRSGFGVAGKSGKFVLAANGAYFLAYRSAVRKYAKNSKITFGYIKGSSDGIDSIVVTPKHRKGPARRTYKRGGGSYLYPMIKIVINEAGLQSV